MRWFPFFILAYIAFGVQIGLRGYFDGPNFVLLAAIFIAVNAPRNAALLGCFILGLMQDLLTQQSPLGLTAFSYGVIGIFVVSTQEMVYRDHFLTHIFLGLIGGLIYAILVYTHGWLYYGLIHRSLRLEARPSAGPLFAGALYTALLAPFVLAGLRRTKRLFGFRSARMHGSRRV